jgi:asparagine synthetase B (glutamine-hydrolysing)
MTGGLVRVANLVLKGDQIVAPEALEATTPTQSFAALRGHFALHLRGDGDQHLLVRDPLGVNKLFFAVSTDGRLDVSNYFIDLRRAGHPVNRIWSVPSGHIVRICPARRTLVREKYSHIAFTETEPARPFDLAAAAARIRERLESTFRTLATALAGRPVYVTMSGGLDSTGVAVLAREIIGDFVGVTFRVDGPAPASETRDDLHYARTVASALGVRLEVVQVPRQALLDVIDPVLLYGQDYRDFNVHCGLVNAALAAAMQQRFGATWSRRPVVLTGDTMNELMADYSPVAYGAREYYGLPRVPIAHMRRFLVNGLDSGDREVGIFARHGIDTIQPYALCADAYCALPGSILAEPTAKQRLACEIFGDRIPASIYQRPKVRAQVGSSDEVGGTLAALVDQGIDPAELERRFAALCQVEPSELKNWIRGGYYRFTSVYPSVH